MVPTEQQKRRPPPIKIPVAPPPRPVPGPNAFALAAKAKQEEAERQAKEAADGMSLASQADGGQPARASSQRRSNTSGLGSAMTSFTQVMQADRDSSPPKSNTHASVGSRHGSLTARSRHSHKSQRSTGSGRPLLGDEDQERVRQKMFDIDEEADKTARADIEDRADQKYLRLVGKYPVSDPRHIASGGHFKDTSLVSDGAQKKSESAKKKSETPKSPKKKIFGMSIPTFGKSSVSLASPKVNKMDPIPAVPSFAQPSALLVAPTASTKASRVLGASPRPSTAVPKKPGRPTPRSGRSPPHSQSSRSLPTTGLQDQHKPHRRRQHYNVSMPSRKRTPSRPSKAADQETYYEFEMRNRGASSPDSTGPPTPPRKDTPKDVKGKEQRDGQPAQEHAELEDSAAKIPNFLTSTKPISSEGGKSPTKFCPLTAADYAKLIEQPYVASARADMSDAGAIELEGDSRHALFKSDDTEQRQRYPGWWNEEREKLFTTVKDNILPPTFYSPSQFSARLFEGRPSHNTDPARLLFTVPVEPNAATSTHLSDGERGSIDMVFQGNVSEIDPFSNMGKAIEGAVAQQQASAGAQQQTPTIRADGDSSFASRVMRELQRDHPAARGPEIDDGAGSEKARPRFEDSSSKLTDILGGVSPSKTGYNYEYQANCPSAVPSPLHNMPPNAMPPPAVPPPAMRQSVPAVTPAFPETLSDGSNILTHFYMCNSHIDVLGRTLYDIIAEGRAEARNATQSLAEKQGQSMAALERRIEEMKIGIIDIKNQTREVARSCDSASELFEQKQTQNQMQNQMQNQILNSKIDKLLQLVKDEVVNRLEQQSKKDDDLEDSVKSLQNTVQELQKTVEALKSETSSKTQASTNPFSSPLPQHRSQPSLNPYLEVANEPGRDNLQRPMQAIPEGRNDARFQYNYGGGNNGTYPHGNGFNNGSQHWYRPSTAGREGKDDNNSYPRAGYMGMGNGNAYGSYYPGGANEQGFGYNSGMSK